jgi:hypothetical protein
MERTTVFLPGDLRRRLADEARRRREPQAALVREALEQFLKPTPERRPRLVGAVSISGVDARKSKAWVRHQWAAKAKKR